MLEFDRQHIWHPYTSVTDPLPVYPVSSAHGVRIELTDGKKINRWNVLLVVRYPWI